MVLRINLLLILLILLLLSLIEFLLLLLLSLKLTSEGNKSGKIQKLKVGKKTYICDSVKDGFYDSISQLKTRDQVSLHNSEHFAEFTSDYKNILELCKHNQRIPVISEQQSFVLLQRMKPDVSDFYSVTPNHYNYAGPAGWKHFHLLLNALIGEVRSS